MNSFCCMFNCLFFGVFFLPQTTRSELLCLCDAFMERLSVTEVLHESEKELLKENYKSTRADVNKLFNEKMLSLSGLRMTEGNLRSIGKWLVQFKEVISNDSLCTQCRSLNDCQVFLMVGPIYSFSVQCFFDHAICEI